MRTLILMLVLFVSVMTACKGCGSDENNDAPATMIPVPGEGEIVVIDTGETDLWSAADGGVLPRLEEPLSADETSALRDGFAWADTEPLAEQDAEGRWALYYVLIYLDSRPAVEALQSSGIFYDMLPIFPEERTRWEGQVGAFGFRGNDEGVFAFAVMHGATYNTLRELALEGQMPFTAVVQRDAPEGYVGDDGSLSYERLAEAGFRYGSAPVRSEGSSPSAIVPASWARAQANLILDTADELRRAATDLAGFFGNEVDFIVDVRMLNTDVAFSATPEPPMVSAWRRTATNQQRPITLDGAKVRLQTDLFLADAPLNEAGIARINAYDVPNYTVCIQARNDAVEVSEFLTPIIACHFAAADQPQRVQHPGDDTPFYTRVVAKDYALNIMAQLTDSHRWMKDMVQFTPRQARVLVGPLADVAGLANDNRAFAVCNGSDDLNPFHGLIDLLGPLRWILANDILFPGAGDGAENSSAATSRGVPTHEYGHFVMCQLLNHMNPSVFGSVWGEIALTAIFDTDSPGASQLWVNEGFADWFSFQVAGGTNYFGFGITDGFDSQRVFYCDPTTSARESCMEDNIGGSGALFPLRGYRGNIAMAATLLHDAFDGPPGYDGPRAAQGVAGRGVWTLPATGGAQWVWEGGAGDADDEPVSLPPRAVFDIVQKFVWQPNNVLRDFAWFDAIARVARDYGFNSEQICQLFEIHAPSGDCLELVSADALDNAAATPQDPFDLTGAVDETNTGTWTWEDASYFATGYRWELRASTGDFREGTTTEPRLVEMALNPNSVYTLEVWTVNNDVESTGSAEHRVVTYATRPTILTTTPDAGAVSLTWSNTNADEYSVEVEYPSGERRVYITTFGTSTRVGGLEGNTEYTFRVTGENQIGVPSPPSDPVSEFTLAVTEIHVSTTGDDAASGALGTPVATLGVALTRAAASSAQVIRFERGEYVEPDAVNITQEITLAGPATGVAAIRVEGVQTRFDCSPGAFNSAGRAAFTAIEASNGPPMHIRDLTIFAGDPTGRDACVSAINFGGSQMTIQRSRIGVLDPAGADITCGVGLSLTGLPNVTIDDSEIFGFADGSTLGTGPVSAAGVCGESLETLRIRDSELSAIASNFPTTAIGELFGVAVSDVGNLEFARNQVSAHANTLAADAGQGTVGGLWAEVRGQAFVHNSVALTPNGGLVNRGIDINATLEADVYVYHVSSHSGDRWGDLTAGPANHQGSALRIAGVTGRIELGNNLLSHAAGYGTSGWGAALNIGEITSPVCDYDIRGNAFSAADRLAENGKSALVIRELTGEFGFITRGVNNPGVYSLDPCSGASQTALSGNVELYYPPRSGVLDDGHVTVVVNSLGQPISHTVGGSSFVRTPLILGTSGIALDSFPNRKYLIQEAVDGSSRNLSGITAIGAY